MNVTCSGQQPVQNRNPSGSVHRKNGQLDLVPVEVCQSTACCLRKIRHALWYFSISRPLHEGTEKLYIAEDTVTKDTRLSGYHSEEVTLAQG